MTECCNSGIMGNKIGDNRLFVFLLTPVFHCSTIPDLAEAPTPYGAGFQELLGGTTAGKDPSSGLC